MDSSRSRFRLDPRATIALILAAFALPPHRAAAQPATLDPQPDAVPRRTDGGGERAMEKRINYPMQDRGAVTWITRAQLATRVPHFFRYDYPVGPQPGRRVWIRVDDRHFVERQPDGLESRSLIFGHATIRGISGTVAIKLAAGPDPDRAEIDGGFPVSIPDKGNGEMTLLFNQAGPATPEWLDPASAATGRRTVMLKVE